MYRYDVMDKKLVNERVAQFRDQTRRFLAGELSDDEFRPLRLQNGLYIQRHAPMLRVAVPYGLLSSTQLRMLAHIARTLRPRLRPLHHAPEHPVQLAEAGGRAATSWPIWPPSRCTPSRPAATASATSPPTSWPAWPPTRSSIRGPGARSSASGRTFHPEFAFLPRKFKIAVSGAARGPRRHRWCTTSACTSCARPARRGRLRVLVGGGLGRTPIIGQVVREFLPRQQLLAYLEAILRVYNRYGRRDNIYKARIKILVKALGVAGIPRARSRPNGRRSATARSRRRCQPRSSGCAAFFSPPPTVALRRRRMPAAGARAGICTPGTATTRAAHKVPGYRAVYVSLKKPGVAPGDMTAAQMEPSPNWPTATASARCVSRTTRTCCWPTSRSGDAAQLWRDARPRRPGNAEHRHTDRHDLLPRAGFLRSGQCRLHRRREAHQRAVRRSRITLYDLGEIDLRCPAA